INDTKTRLTDTQLSAIDIIELKQAAAISSYSDPIMTTFISLVIFCFIIGIWRKKRISWRYAVLPTLLAGILFLDYNRDQRQSSITQSAFSALGMRVHAFNGKK